MVIQSSTDFNLFRKCSDLCVCACVRECVSVFLLTVIISHKTRSSNKIYNSLTEIIYYHDFVFYSLVIICQTRLVFVFWS